MWKLIHNCYDFEAGNGQIDLPSPLISKSTHIWFEIGALHTTQGSAELLHGSDHDMLRASTIKTIPRVPSLTEGTPRGTHLSMEATPRWGFQNLKQLGEDTQTHNGCPNPKSPQWVFFCTTPLFSLSTTPSSFFPSDGLLPHSHRHSLPLSLSLHMAPLSPAANLSLSSPPLVAIHLTGTGSALPRPFFASAWRDAAAMASSGRGVVVDGKRRAKAAPH